LNPVEIATITGNKDTKMLMRYTHLRAEDLMERLGNTSTTTTQQYYRNNPTKVTLLLSYSK
jgi:hypothetical protein